jgi:hypothetical protein
MRNDALGPALPLQGCTSIRFLVAESIQPLRIRRQGKTKALYRASLIEDRQFKVTVEGRCRYRLPFHSRSG